MLICFFNCAIAQGIGKIFPSRLFIGFEVMNDRNRSEKVFERLKEVIPGGVNSPGRAFRGLLTPPIIAKRGEGALLYDEEEEGYIDYCSSWGSLIHGHAHPVIVDSAMKRLQAGSSFGMTTAIEEKLARKIKDRIPSIDKIRFVSSGTEATMSAIRLARGFTKRDAIVKFKGHYHGHSDYLLVQAGSFVLDVNQTATSKGIPQDFIRHTYVLPFNHTEAVRDFLREKGKEIACVIIEPVAGNMGVIPTSREFMEMLRKETEKTGTLLIFDEVITGFRVSFRGAQSLYPEKPDLTCFGKIIGGGFPAAAFGGREDIMNHLAPNGEVYQAGTLSGNPVAMEAGFAALTLTEADNFYEELERKTDLLTRPILQYIKDNNLNACLNRQGSMMTLFFGSKKVESFDDIQALDGAAFQKFFKFLIDKKILISPAQQEASFISMAHSDEQLEYTRDVILEFLNLWKEDALHQELACGTEIMS